MSIILDICLSKWILRGATESSRRPALLPLTAHGRGLLACCDAHLGGASDSGASSGERAVALALGHEGAGGLGHRQAWWGRREGVERWGRCDGVVRARRACALALARRERRGGSRGRRLRFGAAASGGDEGERGDESEACHGKAREQKRRHLWARGVKKGQTRRGRGQESRSRLERGLGRGGGAFCHDVSGAFATWGERTCCWFFSTVLVP